MKDNLCSRKPWLYSTSQSRSIGYDDGIFIKKFGNTIDFKIGPCQISNKNLSNYFARRRELSSIEWIEWINIHLNHHQSSKSILIVPIEVDWVNVGTDPKTSSSATISKTMALLRIWETNMFKVPFVLGPFQRQDYNTIPLESRIKTSFKQTILPAMNWNRFLFLWGLQIFQYYCQIIK